MWYLIPWLHVPHEGGDSVQERPVLTVHVVPAIALIVCVVAAQGWAAEPAPTSAEIRVHKGRPTLFVNGEPKPLPAYSPRGWFMEAFKRETPRFFPHKMGAYFLAVPRVKVESDFWADPFWRGDEISNTLLYKDSQLASSFDVEAEMVMAGDPGAYFIVRFGTHEPRSWQRLHPDDVFVTEEGKTFEAASLASAAFADACERYCRALIQYCESRPWSNRIVGYANFTRLEGTHEPCNEHWLFDHSPVMRERWRRHLREKYGTVEKLRAAFRNQDITFENVQVPKDPLRGSVPEVSARLYWQAAEDNQPLRDYLELQRDLWHEWFTRVARAMAEETHGKKFCVYDAFKQTMMGWNLPAFFRRESSWRLAYPDVLGPSGHISVAKLFDEKGFDGLITPHDYQARGIGGVFEPEGIVDSVVLRGKLFLCEMDTRTYCGNDHYGRARDDREFAAVTWRNMATAITRGFYPYWMDLQEDWYATDSIHAVIERQAQVVKAALNWQHDTVPGIAMVLDDTAVLETSGASNFFNEAIMWEQKMGLARCGVPFRIYLFEDLALDDFPKHRVYYFPNLFRVDDARLELLKKKVFRDGNVVVWGPGSGISDGERIGTESASKLTGFNFTMLPSNAQRRILISNFDHPVTQGLPADMVIGGPLAYGPVLMPTDGVELGLAWAKGGMNHIGMSLKEFGKGAAGNGGSGYGAGDYAAIFMTAVQIPADLWRNIARYAGAHIYCDSNDILMADNNIVALHSIKPERKTIRLPGKRPVYDLVNDRQMSRGTREIIFDMKAPDTRVFLLRNR